MAEAIVHLSGALDENGAAIHPDTLLPPSSSRTADIAPWMDDSVRFFSNLLCFLTFRQPSPLQKHSRFGFSPKPSLSFISLRPSTSSSASPGRSSDTHLLAPKWPSTEEPDVPHLPDDSYDTHGPRKSKSSLFSLSRLKSRSKSRMRTDSTGPAQVPVPPLPEYNMPASVSRLTLAASHSTLNLNKDKREKKETKFAKKLRSVASAPRTPKEQQDPDPDELTLDINLDSMEGIIDPTYAATGIPPNFDPSSPTSAFDSSSQSYSHSHSDHSSFRYQHTVGPSSPHISSADFSNPFLPGSASDLRKAALPPGDFRKASPKTLLPPLNYGASPYPRSSLHGSDSPSWTPPQSWAVHRDGVDKEEGYYTSSDDGIECQKRGGSDDPARPSKSRRVKVSAGRTPFKTDQPLKLRIYRPNGKYHVVTTNYQVEVSSLLPALKERLGLPDRETYRLYLREHSRGT